MVEYLVLVRHGKSQSESDCKDDAARRLTKAGRRALEASLPHALSLLSEVDDIAIWSSPARRAMETAHIAASILKVKDISEHVSLYSQDVDEFLSELGDSNSHTVVAVGHNPFIEQLTTRLDGSDLPIGKGSVTAFRLSDKSSAADASYELAWFVQGPDTACWQTLATMEEKLDAVASDVLQRYREFIGNPEDPETLHRYRVSLRTIRSLVTFVEPYQKHKQNQTLSKDLRKLERLTSQLRDYDILCEEVDGLEAPHPEGAPTLEALQSGAVDHGDAAAEEARPEAAGEKGAGVPAAGLSLSAYCQELRAAERSRVLKALQSKDSRRRMRNMRDALAGIHWKQGVEEKGIARNILQVRLESMYAAFDEDAAKLDPNDVEASHTLRKDAKRLRYISSEFSDLFGEDSAGLSSKMAQIQDGLGALFDARVSHAIISGLDAAALSQDAARKLELLDFEQKQRIDAALQAFQTNSMQ